eukprot:scaffold2065_cov359-Prasinococcus_capsulatus_cf.AAC.2
MSFQPAEDGLAGRRALADPALLVGPGQETASDDDLGQALRSLSAAMAAASRGVRGTLRGSSCS